MATIYSFVVILPNARRANVKASNNSTVLEILEEACKKQQLDPALYDLLHHNKVVDLGNSIRFAAIPNNATLEMALAKAPRVESEVNLGLQLESGKRLFHPFHPRESLWDVLDYWVKAGESVHPDIAPPDSASSVKPVCVYMRQEIVGKEQLEQKTLRSLGLTKGSAVIRLIHRSETQLGTQANVSAPLSRPSTTATGEIDGAEARRNTTPPPTTTATTGNHNAAANALTFLKQHQSSPPPPPPREEENWEPMDVDNRAQTPSGKGQTLGSSSVGGERAHGSVASNPVPQTHQEPFAPPTIKNVQRFSKAGELHILGPHNAVIYHGDDVHVESKDNAVDDSFFDLTVNDVRKMYMQLQNNRKDMEERRLTTQAGKELEKSTVMLTMLTQYPKTVVRIRFADRYILQGVFKTVDKFDVVYNWVKSFLADPALQFYLFTTPPKKVLDRDWALIEQEMVGMTILYFGTVGETSSVEKVLKPEVYTKVSAPDAVYAEAHKAMKREEAKAESDPGSSVPVTVPPETTDIPPTRTSPTV